MIVDPYVSRKEWGAGSNPRPRVGLVNKQYFFVHYAAVDPPDNHSDCDNLVRGIQTFHKSRGFGDIGYNEMVCPHGVHFEGVGYEFVGAHCPNFNRNGIGVCYLGGPELPSPATLAKIQELYNLLSFAKGKLLIKKAHRDERLTSCPGFLLTHWTHNWL